MKKLMICGAIAASLGFSAAQAAGPTQGFDVKATVNAKCVTDTTGTPAVNFGAVDAFGAAPADKTATIAFKCTYGLAPTGVTLSATAGTVAGLAYTLSVDSGTKSAGAAASGSTGATADGWAYVVTGSMLGGQAGDTGAATTDSQTLTINF